MKLKLFGWDVNHTLAVERLKLALANAVQLSYPNEKMLQCVFCDANYDCSSGMVTQISFEDRDRPIHEQRHEPLGFVGHRFHGSELNWAIMGKEAFAIVDTLRKLSYLLYFPHPFRIYTDHRNVISMYNPKKCSKQSAERLMRWGIELRDFNFAIHHISGEDNVWADLLSRWGSVTEETPTNFDVRAVTLAPESQASDSVPNEDPMAQYRVQPLAPEKFVWPDVNEIANEQHIHMSKCGLSTNDDGLFIDERKRVVIPFESEQLRLRLCVIAHAGLNSGHIGYHAALKLLQQRLHWKGMEADLKNLCNSCLHCLPTRSGFRKPRPLGEVCHGTRPNQVVHFDYLYVMPASGEIIPQL